MTISSPLRPPRTWTQRLGLTTATLSWLNDACCDVRYLDQWRSVPRSYTPGQPTDPTWHIDFHDVVVTHRGNGRLFRHAANLLMTYQFYPPDLMSHVSDFGQQNRWAQVGDRIIQRIHLLNLLNQPILDVIGATEISHTIHEPHQVGFTYVTIATHAEIGQWSIRLQWDDPGPIRLIMQATSRPSPAEPRRHHHLMRTIQKNAHLRGIHHFIQRANNP